MADPWDSAPEAPVVGKKNPWDDVPSSQVYNNLDQKNQLVAQQKAQQEQQAAHENLIAEYPNFEKEIRAMQQQGSTAASTTAAVQKMAKDAEDQQGAQLSARGPAEKYTPEQQVIVDQVNKNVEASAQIIREAHIAQSPYLEKNPLDYVGLAIEGAINQLGFGLPEQTARAKVLTKTESGQLTEQLGKLAGFGIQAAVGSRALSPIIGKAVSSPFLRQIVTNAVTASGITAPENIKDVLQNKESMTDAILNTSQMAGYGVIMPIPELALSAGTITQALGRTGAQLIYDASMQKIRGGQLDANFWKNEWPNLGFALGTTVKDAAGRNFKVTQEQMINSAPAALKQIIRDVRETTAPGPIPSYMQARTPEARAAEAQAADRSTWDPQTIIQNRMAVAKDPAERLAHEQSLAISKDDVLEGAVAPGTLQQASKNLVQQKRPFVVYDFDMNGLGSHNAKYGEPDANQHMKDLYEKNLVEQINKNGMLDRSGDQMRGIGVDITEEDARKIAEEARLKIDAQNTFENTPHNKYDQLPIKSLNITYGVSTVDPNDPNGLANARNRAFMDRKAMYWDHLADAVERANSLDINKDKPYIYDKEKGTIKRQEAENVNRTGQQVYGTTGQRPVDETNRTGRANRPDAGTKGKNVKGAGEIPKADQVTPGPGGEEPPAAQVVKKPTPKPTGTPGAENKTVTPKSQAAVKAEKSNALSWALENIGYRVKGKTTEVDQFYRGIDKQRLEAVARRVEKGTTTQWAGDEAFIDKVKEANERLREYGRQSQEAAGENAPLDHTKLINEDGKPVAADEYQQVLKQHFDTEENLKQRYQVEENGDESLEEYFNRIVCGG